mmetsp:Transcript_2965/g.8344  ORF Transcript_2965/g.8344 Transcript_2965/m.8344 type:complete len:104 (-) Transcript_2965:628-939(-)
MMVSVFYIADTKWNKNRGWKGTPFSEIHGPPPERQPVCEGKGVMNKGTREYAQSATHQLTNQPCPTRNRTACRRVQPNARNEDPWEVALEKEDTERAHVQPQI